MVSQTRVNSISKKINAQVVNIDGGCVFNNQKDLGHLIALNLTENTLIKVKNIDC